MTIETNWQIVRNSPLAAELNDGQCLLLAGQAVTRHLEDGEILMREGAVDSDLHVVVSGGLAVTHETGSGDWIALHLLRPRDMAGELGFLDGLEHSATLRAVGSTEIFSVKRERLETLLETDPRLVYLVMRAIVREIHGILRRMNTQHVELSNYISHQHGRY
ncbi:MAG: cyclic nucleotide-binding domain-containing protein [Proteobacteria bacterium]|nr:cyclic nucleotide-binding domain-containing protein [Pseudomonadota bacterium]